MLERILLALSLCLSFTAPAVRAQTFVNDSSLIVQRSNYISRKWHRTIVVGNYLYIDGGEITYLNSDGNLTSISASDTYQVDLTTSWTNQTVSPKQIPKTILPYGQQLNSENLWPGLDNASFYVYNGDISWWWTSDPPANELLKFTLDGHGGGTWTQDDRDFTASSNFTNLGRTTNAAFTCGPDTCYAVGGMQNSRVVAGMSDDGHPACGIVSYNLTSHVWRNDTMVDNKVFNGPWFRGNVFYSDIAGSKGVLILVGGFIANDAGLNPVLLNFNTIYIYDLDTKTWYQQDTGGDIPLPRDSHCMLGIQGDNAVNKTFEIFMYGGWNDGVGLPYDDVWVLSLPSFQWHQAGHTPIKGRVDPWCSVVGQRQMAIVGGWDPAAEDAPDTWGLGFGIFDLSDMVFKDHYDPAGATYKSPQVVRNWYAANGPISPNITSDVKNLFTQTTASGPASPSNTTTASGGSGSGNNKPGSSKTGAIAGGVVGGVVVLGSIVSVIWILRRRNQQRKDQLEFERRQRLNQGPGNGTYEVKGKPVLGVEMGGSPIYEKYAHHQHQDLGRQELHTDEARLQGPNEYHELYAEHR